MLLCVEHTYLCQIAVNASHAQLGIFQQKAHQLSHKAPLAHRFHILVIQAVGYVTAEQLASLLASRRVHLAPREVVSSRNIRTNPVEVIHCFIYNNNASKTYSATDCNFAGGGGSSGGGSRVDTGV